MYYLSLSLATCYHIIYYSTFMPIEIRSSERAKYEAGRIPAVTKGATMAELKEPADKNKIELKIEAKITFFWQ